METNKAQEAAGTGAEKPQIDASGNAIASVQAQQKQRPNNGWAREQEELMADWADIAACYRWLHSRAEKRFSRYNIGISIPVIILSTLTGTANFGMGSLFGDDTKGAKSATLVVGGISLIAGLLTTLNNFLRFAQLSEANKVASISWGKFQRLLAVELAIAPLDRMDARDFLKMCRNELDRLIEQSPQVPDSILEQFQKKFGAVKNLRKPDICGDIQHTHIYIDKDGKLKHIAAEAALILKSKKKILREMIEQDLEGSVMRKLEERMAVQSRLEAGRGRQRSHEDYVIEMAGGASYDGDDDDANEMREPSPSDVGPVRPYFPTGPK
jgi:hypothetical protein